MKGSDKFLLAIVLGIAVLVAAAIILVLRLPPPTYLPEDTPEGVVSNYLLALREGNYERAYGYLSPDLVGFPPNAAEFAVDVQQNRWQFESGSNITLAVQNSQTFSDGTARVEILRTTYNSGPFGGGQYSNTFGLSLAPDNGSWRLVDGEDFWFYCWSNEDCGEPPRVD